MSAASGTHIRKTRLNLVVTMSLLTLIAALLAFLVYQTSTTAPVKGGFFGQFEQVLVGTNSESLRLSQIRDECDRKPDHPWDVHFWLAEACLHFLGADPVANVSAHSRQTAPLQSGYNLLAPPLRAPPVA